MTNKTTPKKRAPLVRGRAVLSEIHDGVGQCPNCHRERLYFPERQAADGSWFKDYQRVKCGHCNKQYRFVETAPIINETESSDGHTT